MSYPATIEINTPEEVANWRPLVQWLMAIPHIIIGGILSYIANLLSFIAWVIILITGKMPAGIANFGCMALRYNARANVYAGFLHTEYPPFEFETTAADPGGTPVTVNFSPALEDRNRVTVFFRLIMLIGALIMSIIALIVAWVSHIIAFFAILFTGKWPAGLLAAVHKGQSVQLRLSAYGMLLTDEFPTSQPY
jgi:hypothetical protein